MSSNIEESLFESTITNHTDENNSFILSKNVYETIITGNKISKVLKDLISRNKTLKIYNQKVQEQSKMHFNAKKKPSITILDYIQRIIEYTNIENSTLIISLIYLDRICQNDVLITEYNIHRLLFICIISSIKYNEDIIYENSFYADIFGIDSEELILLELKFLELINFNLFIHTKQFNKYQNYIINLILFLFH